jgi:hypothetical protein
MIVPVRGSRRVGAAAAVAMALGIATAACGLDLAGLGEVPGQDAAAGDDVAVADATLDVAVGADSGTDSHVPDAQEEARREAGRDSSVEDVASDARDAEGGIPSDAPSDACDAATEICNNGIDDNCNGLIDCADPQCAQQGYVCTPATVPPGWELVGYAESSHPSCPTGWGGAASLVEGPDGGGTCQCACGSPLGNGCVSGTAVMSLGQNVCACGTVQNVPLVSDGGCDPIGAAIGAPCSSWGDGLVKPIGPTTVTCSETTVPTPVTYAAQGQTCAPQQVLGAGCAAGGSCYPALGLSMPCVEAAGVQTSCPPGFPNLHVVYESSNVVDTRECGSCGCSSTPTSCSGAVATLFADPGCSVNAVPITADGGCNDIQGDPSDAGWFKYTATPGAMACAGASSTTIVDAGLLLRAPATICCP